MSLFCQNIEDFMEGQEFSFSRAISGKDVDNFAALSGDKNPLHIDEQFAGTMGFEGRIAHGALLVSFVSGLIGMHLPGPGCLVHTMDIKFISPCYIGDVIKIKAEIDQISAGANAMVLKTTIININTGALLVRGKVQLTLTRPRDKK